MWNLGNYLVLLSLQLSKSTLPKTHWLKKNMCLCAHLSGKRLIRSGQKKGYEWGLK